MDRLEFRLASAEDTPKVEAFNQRLATAGETYHRLSLEKPFRTMAHMENSPITIEKLFCFEGNEIRGGVGIKRMMFRVNGRDEEVAFAVYPISEGIINRTYGAVGLMIKEELLRRYPLIYGLGSNDNSPAKVRQLTGWFYTSVPFHFAVLRAGPFLRNIAYLRKRPGLRTLLNFTAGSGVGKAGLALFNLLQRFRGCYPNVNNVQIERFDQWEAWADEIWQISRDRYELIGDRSVSALRSLYPAGHEHLIKLRFKAIDTGRLIGWAVLTIAKLKNHKYFGDMVLAGLVDMLAVPEDAYALVSGVLIEARRAKADLLVVNHSDERWNEALKRAGMLPWKTNNYLSLSPELKKRFDPIDDYTGRYFFTRGDGHGPTRLWMADYHFYNGKLNSARVDAPEYVESESCWQQKFLKRVEPIKFYGKSPSAMSSSTARISFDLGPERTRKLKAITLQETIGSAIPVPSLLNIFTSLLFAYLYRISGNRQLGIDAQFQNHLSEAVEGVTSPFIRTFPLQVEIDEDETFTSLLTKTTNEILEVRSHAQHIPESVDHFGAYEVVLSYIRKPAPHSSKHSDGSKMDSNKNGLGSKRLSFQVWDLDESETLFIHFDFDGSVFDDEQRNRSIQHFINILDSFIADGTQLISHVNLLSEEEKRRVLLEWNDTQADYSQNLCIQQMFEAQVERTPDAVAVIFREEQLTYRELNCRVNQLAHHLRRLGVGPETLVGICVERSLETIIGLLGIFKAGGAYVPLDPAYPRERLAFMLEDAQVRLLLTQERLLAGLPEHKAHVICLDSGWAAIASESDANPAGGTTPDNLAYVIYTSGSTGEPKGVMIEQRSLVNYTEAASVEYAVKPDDRILQFASINFDASVEEIFPCLTQGATLVLRIDAMLDPVMFLEKCREWEVTVVSLPTAYWHELTARLIDQALSLPPSLRLVIIGGEKAVPQRLAMWQKVVGQQVRLVNTYGPTEATVVATACDLPGIGENDTLLEVVPIGRPLGNLQVYVLDRWLQPVPIGVAGELYISGAGLARGYLNQPDLTAEKFISNPFSKNPEARIYKTGDIVRYRQDGNLEYLGRIDDQVKIRGFRIEPGEIEAVLRQHVAIRDTVVSTNEDASGDKRLVAYIIFQNPVSPPTVSELYGFLKGKLPDYMMPSAFVTLDSFPITPSGKVDRQALPAPSITRPELEKAYVAPRNNLERFLVEIWQNILGLEKIGVFDNFFELGGDSIKGAILINKLQAELGEYVYVVALFDAPTIAQLAEYLQKHYSDTISKITDKLSLSRNGMEEGLVTPQAGMVNEAKVAQLRQLISPLPPHKNNNLASASKNPPAIFVLSPPRSGSTLFRVMLAGHPLLFVPPELDLLSFNTLEDRKAHRLSGGNLGFLEGTIRAIMEIKGYDVEQARRIMEDCENQKLTTQQFYRRMQEWLGERKLVDKSTSYALDIDVLKRAETDFNDPLYIHLLRNPYGMIHSFTEVRLDRIFFRYGHHFTVQELAELIWLVCHQNIIEFLDSIPDHRKYRLKFEDLVNQPRPIMQGICQFLGLEFHPDMLQPYKEKHKRMTDGIHEVSRMIGDVKFHEHRDIDASVAERWKQYYKVDFLGDITWQVAEKLGYSRPEKQVTPNVFEKKKERRLQ